MNETLELKLASLRKKYLGHDESQVYISDIEKRLTTLIEEKKVSENPIFKAIAQEAQKKIDDITALLSNDRKLTDRERDALFAQKEVWLFVSERFSFSLHDSAIKQLEMLIDQRLEQ